MASSTAKAILHANPKKGCTEGRFRPNYTLYGEEETGSVFEWAGRWDEPHQNQSFCGFDQTTSRPAADAGVDAVAYGD